jgi:antitoxin (DNA-binding transcriptional repressor) of toxin-antitoxin stability system
MERFLLIPLPVFPVSPWFVRACSAPSERRCGGRASCPWGVVPGWYVERLQRVDGGNRNVYTIVDTLARREVQCCRGIQAMRIAGIRELRARSAELLGGGEPVVVTRHGRVSGVYLPLDDPDRLPTDLRRELSSVLGRHLSRLLAAQGITNQKIAEDFRAHRKRRR